MIRAKRGMKVQLSKRGSSGRSGAFSVLVSHRKIVFFPEKEMFKSTAQYSRGAVCVHQGDPQSDGQTDRPNTSTLGISGGK